MKKKFRVRRGVVALSAAVLVSLGTIAGVSLASSTPGDLRTTADNLRVVATQLDGTADYVEQLENTPPVTVTETVTATVTETPTPTTPPPTTPPPTTTSPPPSGEIPPTADLQPQRTPQQAASDTFYLIDIRHLDLPSGPAGLLMRQRFEVAQGWEFYDRWHYSCVTTYLQSGGERIAQVARGRPMVQTQA